MKYQTNFQNDAHICVLSDDFISGIGNHYLTPKMLSESKYGALRHISVLNLTPEFEFPVNCLRFPSGAHVPVQFMDRSRDTPETLIFGRRATIWSQVCKIITPPLKCAERRNMRRFGIFVGQFTFGDRKI